MPEALDLTDAEGLLTEAQRAVEIALAKGADCAYVSTSDGRSTELAFRDGKMETVQESTGRSLSVRLYVDGRFSAHSTNDLLPESLATFLEDAVELTRALQPDPHRVPVDPALYAGRADLDLDLFDERLAAPNRERALGWLGELDEAAHADARVISATSRVESGYARSATAGSDGFSGTRVGSSVWYGTEVTVRGEGNKRPEDAYYRGARHVEDLPPAPEVAAEALTRAIARLDSQKAPSARATMVVDHGAATMLFSRLLGALGAGAVQQKRSFLPDHLGQRIASDVLTMTDDPHLVRGLGSRLYDGEGIASRSRPIVEKGELRTYFVDTYYGRKLGWEPTTGGASNAVFALGERDPEAIVADVEDGILVTGWLGGNADATTGDFSFGLHGHRIERGRRAGAVGEMNVTGNLLDLFGTLAELGNDPHPCSSLAAPTAVFEGVQFSGA